MRSSHKEDEEPESVCFVSLLIALTLLMQMAMTDDASADLMTADYFTRSMLFRCSEDIG